MEQTKCVKCLKDITKQEGVNTSKGLLCKSCAEKGKKKKIVTIIISSILLLLTIIGIVFYFLPDRNDIHGFDGVDAIQDSINIVVDEPIKIFSIENAVAMSSPVVVGQTIDNIESFKKIFANNVQNAEKNNASSVIIPNICVLYNLNSVRLTEVDKYLLQEYAQAYLQTNKQATIVIDGYACNLGTNDVNNRISKQRADFVYNELVSLGIPTEKIETHWYGKTKNGEFSYSRNKEYRRVNISIK
jgi:outer membrane protein OmpA-like peptidoglycan-associated protein